MFSKAKMKLFSDNSVAVHNVYKKRSQRVNFSENLKKLSLQLRCDPWEVWCDFELFVRPIGCVSR